MPTNNDDGGSEYRITVRFGDELLRQGHTAVPNLVLNQYAALGISPAEMMFIIHIWQHWWTRNEPYPSLKTIATKMCISPRQAKRYAASLKEQGFLKVTPRTAPGLGQITNEYDFTPLTQAILERQSTPTQTPVSDLSPGGVTEMSRVPVTRMSPEEYEEQKYKTSKARAREGPFNSVQDTSKFRKGSRPTLREPFAGGETASPISDTSAVQHPLPVVEPPARRSSSAPAVTEVPTLTTPVEDVSETGWTKLSEELSKLGIVPKPRPDRSHKQPELERQDRLTPPVITAARAATTPDVPIPQGGGGQRPQQLVPKGEQDVIRTYLTQYAEEFHDQAPKFASTMTRVLGYYLDSGLTLGPFTARMEAARRRTKADQVAGHIRKKGSPFAFFLSLLEEEVGLREPPPAHVEAKAEQAEQRTASPRGESLAGRYAQHVHR